MSELNNGLDKAAAVADKVLDEGVGVTRRVLGLAVVKAKAVVAAPFAFVVGAVVDNQTDCVHVVTHWFASLF